MNLSDKISLMAIDASLQNKSNVNISFDVLCAISELDATLIVGYSVSWRALSP